MTYFLTGSSGFIGNELLKTLVAQGETVHVLVRQPAKFFLGEHPRVRVFAGDVTDKESVLRAMEGCSRVFHLAAIAKAWSKDPGLFKKTNVDGTRHVLECALHHKVEKVVFTSSAGTISPTDHLSDAGEHLNGSLEFLTGYAQTKAMAEEVCREYAARGLHVVIVNPSRVYGPGLLTESNAVTRIIDLVGKGKWRFIPGNGKSFGNYVYIGDVVQGHQLAMEKGLSGEMYILGGENLTFSELFELIKRESGARQKLFKIPAFLLLIVSQGMVLASKLSGKAPMITPEWIRNYLRHHRLSSEKAVKSMGYQITPFEEGARKTLTWLKKENADVQ